MTTASSVPGRETGKPGQSAGAEGPGRAETKTELRLWLRLLACTGMIERHVRSGLREEFGSTLPRFDLLAQLDRAPRGLGMSDLSRRLMVSNGNITGLVERLVQEGLVRRAKGAGDRRTQMVRLTPAGKRAFDAMAPAHEAWIARMMSALEEAEMTRLLDLLGRLRISLERSQPAEKDDESG